MSKTMINNRDLIVKIIFYYNNFLTIYANDLFTCNFEVEILIYIVYKKLCAIPRTILCCPNDAPY